MIDKKWYMKITNRGEWILKHSNGMKDDGSLKWWAKIWMFLRFDFYESWWFVIFIAISGFLTGRIIGYYFL